MPKRPHIAIRLIPLIAVILCAPAAFAAREPAVKLDVRVGFDGVYRAAAWTPVFVTLQSNAPRAVLIELSLPHDASHTMRINALASAGPEPVTLSLLAPLPADLQLAAVVIRDANSGRALADAPLDSSGLPGGGSRFASDFDDLVIAYAGGSAAPLPPRIDLGDITRSTAVAVGALPPNRLPAAGAGYGGLDLLILGAADLARLDPAVQRAIADWVYAGGALLVWPGTEPLPPPSVAPLVELLPADVGENALAAIDPATRASLGLADRFARLPVRALAPRPGARPLAVVGDAAPAYWIDRGLGRAMILPFDPASLLLPTGDAAKRLWRPVVGRLVGEHLIAEVASAAGGARGGVNMAAFSNMNAYMGGFSQNNAIDAAVNLVGNIPGMGRFGFSYVLVILLGLMVVVGPVDWFVLKWLGRQPWTIYTTAGWIALVTLGAVYAGSLVRSGDLHLRTLELVEQAGDRVVARSHVAVVYSPQTRRYEIAGPPETWWRPASAQTNYYVGGGLKTTVAFRQSGGANTPAAASIPVWSMRFLRGDQAVPPDAPPLLTADLSLRARDGRPRLVGTVRNAGPAPLDQLEFTTRQGSARILGPIAPGADVPVDLPLNRNDQPIIPPPPGQPGAPPPPQDPAPEAPPDASPWAPSDAARAAGIDVARQNRLADRLYRNADAPPVVVVLAAAAPETASPITLAGLSPLVEHRRIVRGTFPLRPEHAP